MTDMPLVSIVTPSFNQSRFLESAIRSVLALDYPHIEFIVIDGGSIDGSVEVIQKYADKLAFWVSEPDMGQADAVNKGFAQAKGEVFAWLNSDDTYEAQAVSEAVGFLQENPGIGMVYGDANFIDEKGLVIGRFPAAQTNYRRLRQGYVHIPQQAAFCRASLWRQVGPLDTSLYFAMDYDLWVRLARISELRYHPRVWANFRLHGDSKTILDDDRCWPEMLRVHRRNGGSWFSLIVAKYYLRKVFAPWVTWRRRARARIAK
ncbi:MAG: glycosyltransferase [Anaerolineales bacterium]|nr:MAG: glycosyltransferase [Anaerolineales bacterium]